MRTVCRVGCWPDFRNSPVADRRGDVSVSPCPPLRPKRSAYGLAGRSSGQGDTETWNSGKECRTGKYRYSEKGCKRGLTPPGDDVYTKVLTSPCSASCLSAHPNK